MAAERTFLAWVRTGIALMGFGFVVARFGIFLEEVAMAGSPIVPPGRGLSIPMGIGLIVLGILVTGGAALRHRRYVTALKGGTFTVQFHSRFPFFIAALLIVLGAVMAGYLALIR